MTDTSDNDLEQRILSFLANHGNRAFRPKEIAKRLDLQAFRDYSQFRTILGQLEKDGRVLAVLQAGDRVRVERAASTFQLIEAPGHNYYRTLREKLGWGGQIGNRT